MKDLSFLTDDPINVAQRVMDMVRKLGLTLMHLTIELTYAPSKISRSVNSGQNSLVSNLGDRLCQMPGAFDMAFRDTAPLPAQKTGETA
ncbi:MAG: hypothetical protein AAF557_26455 [Pseudomonadota bacterium]